MIKKLLLTFGILLTLGVNSFAAWDATHPTDSSKIKDILETQFPGNFDAIATGTDAALCVTQAKLCAGMTISDTYLATITTAGKVNTSALTGSALGLTLGGTGQTTRQAAINALSATSLTGTSGQDLVSNGTNMVLGYPASLTIASATTGDLLYYNGSAWVRLADSTSGLPLIAGGVGAAPAYGSIGIGTTANINGTLGIANGGTGQTTAQAAIDALTAVSSATNEYVLTKDTSTGHAIFKTLTVPTVKTVFSAGGTPSSAFMDLGMKNFNASPSDISVMTYFPIAGTLKNFLVNTTNANNSFTVYKNGSATSLVVITNSGNPGVDTTHTVSVSANDYINIGYSGAAPGVTRIAIEFDPT